MWLLGIILCIMSLFSPINIIKISLYLLGLMILFANYKVNYKNQYIEDKDTIYDIFHCICSELTFDKFKIHNTNIPERHIRLFWRLSQLYVVCILSLLILSLVFMIYCLIH
jgi:HJR/Mrr/RecB family endonuclease